MGTKVKQTDQLSLWPFTLYSHTFLLPSDRFEAGFMRWHVSPHIQPVLSALGSLPRLCRN